MTSTSRRLALASLFAILLTVFGAGASAASADDRPPDQRSPSAVDELPVVWDHGLDSQPQLDSAPSPASCYGGQMPWDAGYSDDGFAQSIPGWDDPYDRTHPTYGPIYVTSPNCQDINIRLTTGGPVHARVCFIPTSAEPYCNQGRTVSGTGWHVIADDVLDGTSYWVNFDNPGNYIAGYIAD
jgi:hypothetical protein